MHQIYPKFITEPRLTWTEGEKKAAATGSAVGLPSTSSMTLFSGLDAELQLRRFVNVVVGRNDADNSRELRDLKVRNELADIIELS